MRCLDSCRVLIGAWLPRCCLSCTAVERDCKLSAMASALKDRLRSMGGAAPLNPSEDLVFATCEESCDSWRWLRDPAMHMPDGLLQNKDSKHLHLAFK